MHSFYAISTLADTMREDTTCALCVLGRAHKHAKDISPRDLETLYKNLGEYSARDLSRARHDAAHVSAASCEQEQKRYKALRLFPVYDAGKDPDFSRITFCYTALLVHLEESDLYKDCHSLFEVFLNPEEAQAQRIGARVDRQKAHAAVTEWSFKKPADLYALLKDAYTWEDVFFGSTLTLQDLAQLKDDPLKQTVLLLFQLPLNLSVHLARGKRHNHDRAVCRFRSLERTQRTLRHLRMD